VPLLAGPGTIATAIGFSAGHWEKEALTGIAFLLLCVLTFVSLVMGERLMRTLGRQALGVITRLMGLILAVIGTQMFLQGLKDAGFLTTSSISPVDCERTTTAIVLARLAVMPPRKSAAP
jgi:multiple antibiotic resistance protein